MLANLTVQANFMQITSLEMGLRLFCSVFKKDLHLHLSFSYRFRPSTIPRRSREKPHDSVCPPFWILMVEWSPF